MFQIISLLVKVLFNAETISQGPLGQNGGKRFKFTTGFVQTLATRIQLLVGGSHEHKGSKRFKFTTSMVRENDNSSTAEKMTIVQLLVSL